MSPVQSGVLNGCALYPWSQRMLHSTFGGPVCQLGEQQLEPVGLFVQSIRRPICPAFGVQSMLRWFLFPLPNVEDLSIVDGLSL